MSIHVCAHKCWCSWSTEEGIKFPGVEVNSVVSVLEIEFGSLTRSCEPLQPLVENTK